MDTNRERGHDLLEGNYKNNFMDRNSLIPKSYLLYLTVKYAWKLKRWDAFSLANPGIEAGGMFGDKKTEIYNLLPKEVIPKTIPFKGNPGVEYLLEEMRKENISFPVVIKPNIGLRGFLVKKVNTKEELKQYLKNFKKKELLLQEFIGGNEYSVMYYKYPLSKKSGILAFVERKHASIVGDGVSTVKELVESATIKNKKEILITLKNQHNKVLEKNIKMVLNYIGNVIKGSEIENLEEEIDEDLVSAFSKAISKGLYFIRADIKAESVQKTKKGHFTILDVNGAKAESLVINILKTLSEKKQFLDNSCHIFYEIAEEVLTILEQEALITSENKAFEKSSLESLLTLMYAVGVEDFFTRLPNMRGYQLLKK